MTGEGKKYKINLHPKMQIEVKMMAYFLKAQ